ncbi:MAG: hypothetical protein JWQ96_2794 [Segetibacter sp.]|nr:hypothetical protein [Segetibacter sp.]
MKGIIYYLLLATLLGLISCGNKKAPEEKPTVLDLKEMSDLATVEYTVTKIIKAEDNKTWFKIGDRKILMSCEAQIKAGIDLSSITKDNISENGKDIKLRLPPPKIISFSIPPEKIEVQYQETSVFRDKFSSKERDALAVQAETQIRNNLAGLGIMEQAKANTSLFVNNFLKQLGYQNITITYDDGNPLNPFQ